MPLVEAINTFSLASFSAGHDKKRFEEIIMSGFFGTLNVKSIRLLCGDCYLMLVMMIIMTLVMVRVVRATMVKRREYESMGEQVAESLLTLTRLPATVINMFVRGFGDVPN